MAVVLCTRWPIWLLDSTALQTTLPLLDSDESTVSVQIDVEHPAPVAESLTCTARGIPIPRTVVSLSLKTNDEQQEIASRTHKRQSIRSDRFARRVPSKAPDHSRLKNLIT